MTSDERLRNAMINCREKTESSLLNLGRAMSDTAAQFDNFRLVIPTDDVKEVRQKATDTLDAAMLRAPELMEQASVITAQMIKRIAK